MEVPAFRKNGVKSYTLTALVTGFFIINVKLLMSGVQINEHIKFDSFSGVDYGAALAGLGVVYNWKKSEEEGKL